MVQYLLNNYNKVNFMFENLAIELAAKQLCDGNFESFKLIIEEISDNQKRKATLEEAFGNIDLIKNDELKNEFKLFIENKLIS